MIDWTDLPENHHLGWASKKEKERLESGLESVEAELEVGDQELEELVQEELEGEKEKLSSQVEEEKDALKYQKQVLRRAGEKAKNFNRENGLLRAEQAQKIDGFHYVHSQTWFPILDEIYNLENNLEQVSRSVIDVDHPAEAYGIPRSEYSEITQDLKDSLAGFVAIGGGEEQIRQKSREALSEELTKYMSSEEAEKLVESISGNLYWKKQDEYIAEEAKELLDKLDDRMSEAVKNQLERIVVGEDISEDFYDKLDRFVDEEDQVVSKLKDMQSTLKNKSRGRLINALRSPEELDFTDALIPVYRRDWLYELAIAWEDQGDPHFSRDDTVHSKLGKMAANIDRHHYKGKTLIKKDLLELMNDLGVEFEEFRYWSERYSGTKIKNPDFPIQDFYEGRIYGSLIEGKTHWSDAENAWVFEYSKSKNTAPVRKEAMEKLKLGETFTENERGKEISGVEELWENEKEEDSYREVRFTIPSMIKDLTEIRGINVEEATNEEFLTLFEENKEIAQGYVSQAIWERGTYVQNNSQQDELRITSKRPDLLEETLEYLEIDYGKSNKSAGESIFTANLNTIERLEGRTGEELNSFCEMYREDVETRIH